MISIDDMMNLPRFTWLSALHYRSIRFFTPGTFIFCRVSKTLIGSSCLPIGMTTISIVCRVISFLFCYSGFAEWFVWTVLLPVCQSLNSQHRPDSHADESSRKAVAWRSR
jgi:hypothetical protein